MTLTSWRIVKARYAAAAFDGEGAFRFGGRWNSPGTRLVYTSESDSLAALEMLVHLSRSALLGSYAIVPVTFEESLVERVDPNDLSSDWNVSPIPASAQRLGDVWIREQRSVVLAVPSVVSPRGRNYLINTEHPDFATVQIGDAIPWEFDQRLA